MAKTSKRKRKWSLVCYLTTEQLIERILKIDNIQHYAFIEHNKDMNADETPTDRHIHMLLILRDARTAEQITRKFVDSDTNAGNCFAEPTRCNTAVVEYFTHKNEPEKYQYPETEIFSDNIEIFREDEETEDNTNAIYNEVKLGTPIDILVKRYGKGFLYHIHQFEKAKKWALSDKMGIEADENEYPTQYN